MAVFPHSHTHNHFESPCFVRPALSKTVKRPNTFSVRSSILFIVDTSSVFHALGVLATSQGPNTKHNTYSKICLFVVCFGVHYWYEKIQNQTARGRSYSGWVL